MDVDDDDDDDDDDGPRADGGWRQPLPRIPSWRKGGLRLHVEKWMGAEANFALDLWKTWYDLIPSPNIKHIKPTLETMV